MSRLFQNEPDHVKPRQKPRKMMHVMDACGPNVRFECDHCNHETDWMSVKNVIEGKRGIPCPKCNPE